MSGLSTTPRQLLLFCLYVHWRSYRNAVTHKRNNNSKNQGRSPNVTKVSYHTLTNCSYRKEFAPVGGKFFPIREVPILKREVMPDSVVSLLYAYLLIVLATPLTFMVQLIYSFGLKCPALDQSAGWSISRNHLILSSFCLF